VAWAHPKFGVLLASCSYDGSVIVFRESPQNQWSKIYEHKFHDSSVNSISWAPAEYGLILACASSDGKVSTLEHKGDTWVVREFNNDILGCNAVSWAPFGAKDATATATNGAPGSAAGAQNVAGLRLVTGSCDNTVRFWRCDAETHKWAEESKESGYAASNGIALGSISGTTSNAAAAHTDWVRDVAWCPTAALAHNVVASCGEDRKVNIWTDDGERGAWRATALPTFNAPVWRLSWNVTGNVLAVSTGDHQVSLWKQSTDERWVQLTGTDAAAATQ